MVRHCREAIDVRAQAWMKALGLSRSSALASASKKVKLRLVTPKLVWAMAHFALHLISIVHHPLTARSMVDALQTLII